MENVRHNIEYDLLLQKFKIPSYSKHIEGENNDDIEYHISEIFFVICNSCYWCATYLTIDELDSTSQVLRCQLCNSHNTELTPTHQMNHSELNIM